MAEGPRGWTIRSLIAGKPSTGPSALEELYGPGYVERLRRQKAETGGEYGFKEETIGPVADEIAGYLPATVDWIYGQIAGRPQEFSKLRDERLAIAREEQAKYREEHPVASVGANVLGALGVTPAGAAGRALTYGGRLLAGAKAGAAGGAVGGAAEASGGVGQRATGAAVGAAVGGALGTMIPVGLDVAARLVRGVRNTLGITGRGATQRARQLLIEAMEKDGISFSDLANKEASGKPLTLADLGPNTRDLIGAAHRAGGEAKATVEEFFESRTKGQLGRMTSDLAQELGEDPAAFRATAEQLVAEKAKASPLYRRLYGKTTPMNDEMRELLNTPAGKRAYMNALNWWANKRRAMPKDGSIPFEVLDQTKKEIDALIRYGKTPQGGAEIGGRSALEDFRSDFVATLDKRFKGYAAARFQSADPSKSLDAMDAGRKFLRAEGEDITAELADMTPIERDLFRLGAARELRAKMGAKIDSGDISSMFQNENMRERLQAIFPDEKTFRRFMDSTVTERTMQETRNAILKGSPTAARLAADEDLAQGALETAAGEVMRGRAPLAAAAGAVMRGARGAKERTVRGINQAVAGELAGLGTRTDLGDVGSRLAATAPAQPPSLPVRPGLSQAPGGLVAGAGAGRAMEPAAPRAPAPPPEGWQIKGRVSEETASPAIRTSGGHVNVDDITPELRHEFGALQRRFGRDLVVTSGYRDPEYNRRVGGARRSRHMRGDALDISTAGMSLREKQRLVNMASEVGFTGIGIYGDSIHLDMGNRRAWGPNRKAGSVPGWARPMINRHLKRGSV